MQMRSTRHGAARGYCATCRSAASADSAVGSAPGMSASSGARAPGSDTDAGSGMLALSYTTTSAVPGGDGALTGDALRLRLRLGRAR